MRTLNLTPYRGLAAFVIGVPFLNDPGARFRIRANHAMAELKSRSAFITPGRPFHRLERDFLHHGSQLIVVVDGRWCRAARKLSDAHGGPVLRVLPDHRITLDEWS